MASQTMTWALCGLGFFVLAIAGLALGVVSWIQGKEIKKLRGDVTKCVIRIIDLEKGEKHVR